MKCAGSHQFRATRYLLPACLAISLGGCRLFEFDNCLYELRGVEGAGTITENGTELLYGRLNLLEQRDYQPDKSLIWEVRGAPLKGHVTSATFRDVADPSKVLLMIPLSSPSVTAIAGGAANQSAGAELNGFFDVLAANRGVIDVRADLPGRDSIRVPLAITFHEDWYRPKCG
ncbi:MAG: hypothetical protein ABR582_05695 [Gemmatimonadaceae bacterium]